MPGKILIIVSQFNELITKLLLEGALDELKNLGIKDDAINVVKTPGCFEIPTIAAAGARSAKYQSIICLGAIIQGETPHFDFVCQQTAAGIMQVGFNYTIPTIFGIITTHNNEQALARCGIKGGNKGREAAKTAIEMISTLKKI
ncbi:MAG: 6,7-dimethyl-8-ribityllumazine synthase [Oligoflexales bacterium]|nr:6,7-dimethyl-8-ribityllumazine synthase [Oligoflexales bacterium]